VSGKWAQVTVSPSIPESTGSSLPLPLPTSSVNGCIAYCWSGTRSPPAEPQNSVNPNLTPQAQPSANSRRLFEIAMRVSTLVLAACVAVGAVAVLGFHLNSTASAAAPVAGDPGVERFVLQSTGDLPSCLIEKPRGEAAVIRVEIAPECDQILP